jgi:hypothetical protein
MKQKDIALLLIIVIVSAALSFFIGQKLFASPASHKLEAEYVDPITSTFTTPSSKYFNENSVNPTQQIRIGDSSNVTPFSGRQ